MSYGFCPIEGLPKKRRIIVYDFEWIPNSMDIRLCGAFDGVTYRSFLTVEAFLQYALSSENEGAWFFAHYGGRADLLFLLESISGNSAFSIEGRMSGSSCVIADITHDNRKWSFVDSFWLFRTSLAKIATPLGMKKTGPDFDDDIDGEAKAKEWYATVPILELKDYNENDCRILWRAITEFERVLLDMGGELMMTIASCAMRLFRRKYLKRTIKVIPDINKQIESSYCASRVEVFQHEAAKGYAYDINSSFPYAMTFDLPGNCKRRKKALSDSALYIADCTIQVPPMKVPPLPYRRGPRLFFPIGTWRAWFTSVDIQLLEDMHGRIEKVHDCYEYESIGDMKDYALDIYEKRKGAAKDSFESVVYKYLLNSLYGKMNESEEKTSLIVNPSAEEYAAIKANPLADSVFPGAWMVTNIVEVPHAHLPAASFITAIARRTLYKHLVMPMEQLHYCDTDCLSTNRDDLPVTSDLGGLKLESTFENATYLAPKLYSRTENGKPYYKAKGFSLGRNSTKQASNWQKITEGKEVEIERMARLREMLRAGTMKPYEMKTFKAFRQTAIPKRKRQGIHTRPWTITELESMKGF
jgi:hypothetical protein